MFEISIEFEVYDTESTFMYIIDFSQYLCKNSTENVTFV